MKKLFLSLKAEMDFTGLTKTWCILIAFMAVLDCAALLLGVEWGIVLVLSVLFLIACVAWSLIIR